MRLRRWYTGWLWLCCAGCLVVSAGLPGCTRPAPRPVASEGDQVPPPAWPLFTDDLDRTSLQQALQRSLDYLERLPADRLLPMGDRQVLVASLRQTLAAFQDVLGQAPTSTALQAALEQQFELVPSRGRDGIGEVLFTGYYEIALDGSRVRTKDFSYPLYTPPTDLQGRGKDLPYLSRREIDLEGKLRGRGLEILWLRNPVDGFFLHVQGSGQIRLPHGQIQRVKYAASNNHPYQSIGRVLINEGRIPREGMSMQRLRGYFRDHPAEVMRILTANPRYVFFRQVHHEPQGNLGVTLVPGRSIATDQQLFPPAGLAFIQTQKPVVNDRGEIVAWQPCSRFVFNHDTGNAIRGPGRVDLFWGSGFTAEIAAGHMQHTGKLFFLLKRPSWS